MISALVKAVEQTLTNSHLVDFRQPEQSPGGVITRKAWNEITHEFPRLNFRESLKNISVGFCITKPETTYDSIMRDFGEAFVPGYKYVSFLDTVWKNVPEN
jgi:hypothetical protein